MTTTTRREHLYGLEGVYLDAYDAIVRPDQVFPVRVYTLRRWTPILGATAFWLLVALQQRCFRNRGRNWCTVKREELVRDAGLGWGTLHRYLRGEEHYKSGLCHWVRLPDPAASRRQRRWSARAGRMTQAANTYQVVLDAPLAPVDQRGLAQYLIEHGARPGVHYETVTPALEPLAETTLADLLELFDECAARFHPPAGWDVDNFYPTVADVVSALGIQVDAKNSERFLALCSRVQQALVGRTWLGTQYFLKQWRPVLGDKLALVVVQLRSRCFWNEETLRDEVSIGTEDLATAAGCTAGWLRTVFDLPHTRKFFVVSEPGLGRRPPTFRVTLKEPLTPQDEVAYQALLTTMVVSQTGQLVLPEPTAGGAISAPGGQLGMPKAHAVDNSDAVDACGGQLGMSRAHVVDNSDAVDACGGQLGMPKAHVVDNSDAIDACGGQLGMPKAHVVDNSDAIDACGGQRVISTILVNIYHKTLKEQQHEANPAAMLLDEFGIGLPNSKRILERNPDADSIRAWMLYTLSPTQPGLNEPDRARRYVVTRLLDDDRPPERFHRWARLTPDEWLALWRADCYGGAYVEALPPALAADFDAWREDFSGLFPDGPFGDNGFDWTALQTALADRLPGLPAFNLCEREGEAVVEVCPASEQTDECAWADIFATRSDELISALREYGVLHRVVVAAPQAPQSPLSSIVPDPSVHAVVKDNLTARSVWEATLNELQLQMTQATFDTWLRDSRLVKCEDSVFFVEVKSAYAREWLENRLLALIERTLARVSGRAITVRFVERL